MKFFFCQLEISKRSGCFTVKYYSYEVIVYGSQTNISGLLPDQDKYPSGTPLRGKKRKLLSQY